jgi:hypothetical protein
VSAFLEIGLFVVGTPDHTHLDTVAGGGLLHGGP